MKRPAELKRAILALHASKPEARLEALGTIRSLSGADMVDVRTAQPAVVMLLVHGTAAERRVALEICEYRADMGQDIGMAVPALLRLQSDADPRTQYLARRALSYADARLLGALASVCLPYAGEADSSAEPAEENQLSAAFPQQESHCIRRAIELYREQRAGREADEFVAQAMRQFPNSATLANIRGTNLAWGLDRHAEALPYYRDAVALAPRSASNAFCLAWCLFWLGDGEAGEAEAKRSLKCKDDLDDEVRLANHLCLYLCAGSKQQSQSLKVVARLINKGQRVDAWRFDELVEQARQAAHAEAEHLARLSEVVLGKQPPSSLAGWDAWKKALPK